MNHRPKVLLLDHRDSFVFVLADQLARVGADIEVVRIGCTLAEWRGVLAEQRPDLVVLSPGPGHPADAELALQWLATRPRLPVLGVCLGHQAIGLSAGARIARCADPAHGEAIEVEWRAGTLRGVLPPRMPVARYHSLIVVDPPPNLRVLATARTAGSPDGRDVVMAIEHTELPQLGLQFHPESVLTPHGSVLLQAVLRWATQEDTARATEQVKR